VNDTTTTPTPETLDIPEDATPKARDRIVALSAEKAQLRSQLDGLAPQLAAAATMRSELDTLRAQHDAARAEWQAAQTGWTTERAILSAGIVDPEAADIVAHAYSRVATPAEGAKPTLAEWLSNRDALPKGVRAYLPDTSGAAAAPATTGQAPAPVALPPTPSVNAGASSGTAAPAKTFSPEAILQMLGTPQGRSAYAANRTAILASLK
jgi:hypothetical protein